MVLNLLRSDLPLGQEGSARFLPWIVGAMVYLAALALAGALAAGGTGRQSAVPDRPSK